jgi:hypothetical protein
LRSGDEIIRSNAAITLGNIGNRAAIKVLIPILRADDSALVRGSAAEALGKLRALEAVEDLTYAIYDPVPSVTTNALYALGLLQEWTTTVPIIGVAGDLGLYPVKENGVMKYYQYPYHKSGYAFLRRFQPMQRTDAAYCLGRRGHASAAYWLMQSLNDPDWSIRFASVLSLGLLRDSRAYYSLQYLAGREDNLRTQAILGWAVNETKTTPPGQQLPVGCEAPQGQGMMRMLSLSAGGIPQVQRTSADEVPQTLPDLGKLMEVMAPGLRNYDLTEEQRRELELLLGKRNP